VALRCAPIASIAWLLLDQSQCRTYGQTFACAADKKGYTATHELTARYGCCILNLACMLDPPK
jgi:hypothetical protein